MRKKTLYEVVETLDGERVVRTTFETYAAAAVTVRQFREAGLEAEVVARPATASEVRTMDGLSGGRGRAG